MRTLSHEQVRAFYDRFARLQDRQDWYEAPAVDDLRRHATFERATAVLEFGCGTGKLARTLFEHAFPSETTYLALDLSPVMVALARERLRPFAPRTEVRLTDGGTTLDLPDRAFDRFVVCYVLDLLSREDARALIDEAHRVLRADGLLCAASLARGTTSCSRLVGRLWAGLFALAPGWVGGCRPIDLRALLPQDRWTVVHHRTVVRCCVASEVLVARPVP